MTIQQLRKLPAGASVVWNEDGVTGKVVVEHADRWIEWTDGQTTDGKDDWALENVSIVEAA